MFLLLFIVCLLSAVICVAWFSVYTWLKSREHINHSREPHWPSITLLVCVYNEEAVIAKKIDNIAQTYYPADKLHVMFINDHSTDKTRAILDEQVHKIPFDVTVLDNAFDRSKPNALNFAFPKIKSEIIVQTDADSFLDKDALRFLAENFTDPDVGGANGEIQILKSGGDNKMEADEIFYRKFYNIWRKGESHVHSISICNGPIAAFRTNLVQDIWLDTLADDTEILFNIIAKGYRFVYDDRAKAYEFTPSDFSDRIKQKIRRCKGVLQVYFRNFSLLYNGKYDWHIFLPVLMQFTIVPYCVLIGTAAYAGLIFQSPYWLIPLAFLLIPKIFRSIFNIWLTHIIMAFAPFYFRRKWDVIGSSRRLMQNTEINDL